MQSASPNNNSSSFEFVLVQEDLARIIIEQISNKGYVVLDSFLSFSQTQSIFNECIKKYSHQLKQASIGRSQNKQINQEIRSDKIFWLENPTPAIELYLNLIDEIRQILNRELYLGLNDFECHFAAYEEGAFYKKHLDVFKTSSVRTLSSILYLNETWVDGDGGELIIYKPDNHTILETIAPVFGRQVFFLSKDFPHEVLPTQKARYSLTGWLRTREI